MPQHGSAHKEMVIYADLMLWLKSTDLAVFHSLASVYTKNLSRLYVREVTEFLESAKQRLLSKEAKGKHSEHIFLILCDCYFCVFIYLFFFLGGESPFMTALAPILASEALCSWCLCQHSYIQPHPRPK